MSRVLLNYFEVLPKVGNSNQKLSVEIAIIVQILFLTQFNSEGCLPQCIQAYTLSLD